MKNNQSENITAFRFSKKAVIISVAVLITLIAASTFFIKSISSIAKKELLVLANSELAPNAVLETGHFKVGFFPVRVTIEEIKLNHTEPFESQIPEKPLHMIRKLEMKSAELRGLSLYKMIFSDEWDIGSISLDGIDLELVRSTERRLTDSTPLTIQPDISINEIKITNSRVDIYPSRAVEPPSYSIQNLHIMVNNFHVEDIEKPIHTYFEEFRIEADSVFHFTDDGFYEISATGFIADSEEKSFSLENFILEPLLSSHELALQTGYQKDMYTISGCPCLFNGIEIKNWLKDDDIRFNYAEFNALALEIERDKTLEKTPRDLRLFLNQKFRDLPFSVSADSIVWSKGLVSYTEKFHNDNRSGTILFTDIHLILDSIQNRSETEAIMARAGARFMNSSDLNVEFEFFPSETADHSVTAGLSGMDLRELSSTLENLAFIQVKEGTLKSLDFSFSANQNRSSGKMTMIYDDLEFRFLDDKMGEGTMSRIKSMVVNTFAVHSSNDEHETRFGIIDYEREADRSMFNFWWRSIESGLMDTVKR
jgi:hypothetical protein